MPNYARAVPLFDWHEIATKVAYCTFAGFIAGLSVGAYVAIVGALPTATLSILAFPICGIGGIFLGALAGLMYGVGSCLVRGVIRSLQNKAIKRADEQETRLGRTNSVSLHSVLTATPARRKSTAEKRDDAPSLTASSASDAPLFQPLKKQRLQPPEHRGCLPSLLACFR